MGHHLHYLNFFNTIHHLQDFNFLKYFSGASDASFAHILVLALLVILHLHTLNIFEIHHFNFLVHFQEIYHLHKLISWQKLSTNSSLPFYFHHMFFFSPNCRKPEKSDPDPGGKKASWQEICRKRFLKMYTNIDILPLIFALYCYFQAQHYYWKDSCSMLDIGQSIMCKIEMKTVTISVF